MAATSQTDNKDAPGDLSDIKRKLAWRMGFAGLMIIGLLGGLALFDHYSGSSETETGLAPQFNEPVPVAKKVITQPVTSAEPGAEMSKDDGKPSAPESSTAPIDKSPVQAEPPPRPEIAAQPALPRASQTVPAVRATAAPVVSSTPTKPAEPKPAVVSQPQAKTETSLVAEVAPIPTPQPALSRLFSGFALQAGVFSDPRRAEELHAKLLLEGIPSSIEARVEVGPFKTRAEADTAREKLKALGVDTVLLMPKGTKR